MNIKKSIWAILGIAVLLMGARAIKDNIILVGDSTAGDKEIIFDIGADTNNPRFKWNNATGAIQFTNDNVTLFDVGSGGGSGSGGINLVGNPGFETGVASDWTGGGTFEETDLAAEVGFGGKSAKWTPTGAAQTVVSDLAVVENGLENKTCLARINYRWPSGTDDQITFQVKDSGGDPLTVVADLKASESWTTIDIGFVCPEDESVSAVFTSVSAVAAIFLDDIHVGNDFRIGESAPIVEAFKTCDSVSSNIAIGSGTQTCAFSRVGDVMHLKMNFMLNDWDSGGTFNISPPNGLTINPAAFLSTTLNFVGNATVRDQTANAYWTGAARYGTANNFMELVGVDGDTSLWGGSSSRPFDWLNNDDSLHIDVKIPILEWKNQGTTKTVTLDNQDWYVDATMGDSNISLSAADESTYLTPNSSLNLIVNPGSAPVQIACDGAVSTGTNCAGNEDTGVTVEIPRSGAYEVCFNNVITNITVNANNESSQITFRAVHTNEDDSADIKIASGMFYSKLQGSSGTQSQDLGAAGNTCGIFNLGLGRNTFRLKYVINVNTTPISQLLMDRATGPNGTRELNVVIKPINSGNSTIAVTPAENGTVGGVYYNEEDIVNPSPFTGTLRFSRVGRVVTISSTILSHASGSAPGTSAGVVPLWARPSHTIRNTYTTFSGSTTAFIEIDTSGIFRTRYYTANGTASNRVDSAFGGSITYNVD